MEVDENKSAKPEYATAKIAVWWDIKDCPIPVGYDAGRVRPSLEGAFKSLGYSGPVSITAYGDQKQTSNDLLRALSSTGVAFAHSTPKNTCSDMYSDLLEWRDGNPPPATMMLISDHVKDVLAWDLARLQQHTKYNLFRAYSVSSYVESVLLSSAEWVWGSLLLSDDSQHDETRITTELSAMFCCKSCLFDCQSLRAFRKHFSSRKHVLEEAGNSGNGELDPETRMWGRNYQASPEHATAQIAVWWDMHDCPVPDGYDARRVRPSLEGAFKSLGYSGPVSITAFGDLNQTSSDDLLRALASTGVSVAHSIPEKTGSRMLSSMWIWRLDNPPPATMMIISNESGSGKACLQLQFQRHEDKLLRSAVKGVVNGPECFIANRAFVISKALVVSGSISQVKNMHWKRIVCIGMIDHVSATESKC